jgi:hypothetical protein
MPFPEPETAIAATIDRLDRGRFIQRKTLRLEACQEPSTTFQSLARRRNDLRTMTVK